MAKKKNKSPVAEKEEGVNSGRNRIAVSDKCWSYEVVYVEQMM
jgi:hypothetical protein